MGPGVWSPCLLLLWGWSWGCALPAGSILPPGLSKAEVTRMFKDFMIQFNRTYRSPAEQQRRFGIFMQSLVTAQQLQETELGTGQYGVTRFSDWTDEEFRGVFQSHPPPSMAQAPRLPRGKLPTSCDWRKAGAVTAVRNQGMECRSCWAFAAVSNIESLWNIHFHQPRNLSVQEVLDCSWCGAGCNGGYVWDAFTTVLRLRGLTSEADYPYKGKTEKCKNNDKPSAAYIQGFQTLPEDEEEIAAHVASQGPITVTLNSAAMKYYKRGISQPLVKNCSPDQLDHVVLLVGYGAVNERQFWIIKNSWGDHWGEQGYYRLYRGRNACGVSKFPVTAIVQRLGAPGSKVHCPS
ncbi:cathepsin W-like isoform X1 [Pelodiscus sinensis]|uniref:cathepsin W-like isoform X1 n=1 Tax=Pelodiscus sinensis TaxID=13735 RepID=UPI003F6C9DB2